jgi:Zn-dependent protease with chaperone function
VRAYKLKVVLLAFLGYGYILAILGYLAFTLKIVLTMWQGRAEHPEMAAMFLFTPLIIAFVIWTIVRAIFRVRIDPPTGIALTAERCPRLFELIEELRKAMGAPALHAVLLTEEFNAGVRQVPAWGLFGRPKNYLVLGLPLLEALGPEAFRAALVHELGHLAGSHGRLGAWIYRLRGSWSRLADAFDAPDARAFVWIYRLALRRFFLWYAPFFRAYSLALARHQEHEADKKAAELAGANHLAACLVQSEVAGRFLRAEFWPEIERLALQLPEPPADLFDRLRARLPALRALAQPWLDEALGKPEDPEDTHPSLAQRLAAIGVAQARFDALSPSSAASAADVFLGDAPKLRAAVAERWALPRQNAWRRRHTALQEEVREVRALEAKTGSGALEPAEAWKLYRDAKHIWGAPQAAQALRWLLSRWPRHAAAGFEYGVHLLESGDPMGASWLEQAAASDRHLIPAACAHARRFAHRSEVAAQATRLDALLLAYERDIAAAESERASHSAALLPHAWPELPVRRLRAQLETIPKIRAVYLVRKEIKSFPERPFYFLAVIFAGEFHSEAHDTAILDKIAPALAFPAEARVLALFEPRLRWRLWRFKGALLYRRPHTWPELLWSMFFWGFLLFFGLPLGLAMLIGGTLALLQRFGL